MHPAGNEDHFEDELARRRERQDRRDRMTDHAPAPRLVVAGDVVAELERQHRKAARRRQEENARRARRRAMFDDLAIALLALAAVGVLTVLAAMFAGPVNP